MKAGRAAQVHRTGNDYRSKCDDVLNSYSWGVKASMDLIPFVDKRGWQVKLNDP